MSWVDITKKYDKEIIKIVKPKEPDKIDDIYKIDLNVKDIDEVLGGSGKVEQYATKAKNPRYTKGAAEVDEAEGRALSEIDRLKDEGLIDD